MGVRVDQLLAAARLLKLSHSLSLDLADSLSRDLEDVPDFLKGVAVTVAETVPEFDDLSLTIAERLQHFVDSATQHLLRSTRRGAFCGSIGQQVAKLAVLVAIAITLRCTVHGQACHLGKCHWHRHLGSSPQHHSCQRQRWNEHQ